MAKFPERRAIRIEKAGIKFSAFAMNKVGLAARWKSARPLIMMAIEALDETVREVEEAKSTTEGTAILQAVESSAEGSV